MLGYEQANEFGRLLRPAWPVPRGYRATAGTAALPHGKRAAARSALVYRRRIGDARHAATGFPADTPA